MPSIITEKGRFRTAKISNPRFENNYLQLITVKTTNLKGRGNIVVFTPPTTTATDLPIIILLHGVYGCAWDWTLQAGAHFTAHKLMSQEKIAPMILAMPSDGLWGDGSGYLDHHGYHFEKWIVEDVIDAVRLYTPAAKDSKISFLSGLSMGGFGALRIGAKYSSIFKAFGGHSSITDISQMASFVEEPVSAYQQKVAYKESVWLTMRRNRKRLSPFRFDCGSSDILIEPNRLLHQQLETLGIPHEYEEFKGGHEWPYWEAHLTDMLLFFNRQLE